MDYAKIAASCDEIAEKMGEPGLEIAGGARAWRDESGATLLVVEPVKGRQWTVVCTAGEMTLLESNSVEPMTLEECQAFTRVRLTSLAAELREVGRIYAARKIAAQDAL